MATDVETSAIDLSIVLPCYRAATLAHRSVAVLSEYLGSWTGRWEIIIVDDGGGDFDDDAFAGAPRVHLIRLPHNLGKGAAVSTGMLVARGGVRIFTDIDLPYDCDLLLAIAAVIHERGFHLVVGDRTLSTSSYAADIGFPRRAASALFSTFVGTLVTGGFFDTQCGLKGVRGDVADELFRLVRIHRFAFDVEVIYLALKHRLDIHRIPVQLRNNETSSIRLLRDATRGVIDIARIKWHQMTGCYESRLLEDLVSREFDQVRESATAAMPSKPEQVAGHVIR